MATGWRPMARALLYAKNKTTPETVEFGDFFLYLSAMYQCTVTFCGRSPGLEAIIKRK